MSPYTWYFEVCLLFIIDLIIPESVAYNRPWEVPIHDHIENHQDHKFKKWTEFDSKFDNG